MSENSKTTWHELVEKYFNNSISKEELDQLLQMAGEDYDAKSLESALKAQWETAKEKADVDASKWDDRFNLMMDEANESAPVEIEKASVPYRKYFRMAAAAIILVMLGSAITYLVMNDKSTEQVKVAADPVPNAGQAPTGNKAIITLANGEKIYLDSAGTGTLADLGNVNVVKTGDGQITYNADTRSAGDMQYNTLFNPRGSRVVSLRLSDGTRVWLNSESSLRYPATFSGNERNVEITGEAYFEVAKDASKPFHVRRAGDDMVVEVLGTHFNMNVYEDESSAMTTLIEGKVNVRKGMQVKTLVPGSQAQVQQDRLIVLPNVDTDAVVAWKNGFFSFAKTDMATLMRQIGRWYNVEVEYAGKIPDRKFGGEISRDANLKEVLKILEESKIYFRMNGRKVIISE
ncbi:FecR family protein [Flavihumibacter solisilvae]|uniref:FecR family protein n=1 Tax=Flavihumibacter solisilvae TaxID=1349421 RepID=UPI00068D3D26|nr:FecR family protein [Flavihumibacter solisilvae]